MNIRSTSSQAASSGSAALVVAPMCVEGGDKMALRGFWVMIGIQALLMFCLSVGHQFNFCCAEPRTAKPGVQMCDTSHEVKSAQANSYPHTRKPWSLSINLSCFGAIFGSFLSSGHFEPGLFPAIPIGFHHGSEVSRALGPADVLRPRRVVAQGPGVPDDDQAAPDRR